MSIRAAAALIALVALFSISVASGTARQREAWEYYVHTTDSVGTLNKWGQDGWEVAAAYAYDNGVRVVMKRRKG